MHRFATIVLGLTVLAAGCDRAATSADPEATTIHLTVEGMSCENCVAAITHALEGLDGVVSCEVSLEDESANRPRHGPHDRPHPDLDPERPAVRCQGREGRSNRSLNAF